MSFHGAAGWEYDEYTTGENEFKCHYVEIIISGETTVVIWSDKRIDESYENVRKNDLSRCEENPAPEKLLENVDIQKMLESMKFDYNNLS